MVKIIISILLLFPSFFVLAQLKLPAISPSAEVTQKVGLTDIKLSYSRPGLRGRSLFGREGVLVIGQKWRTGANAVTTLEVSGDIILGDKILSEGKYVILSTPGTDHWTYHLYGYEQLPYTQFLDKQPLLEIAVPLHKAERPVETLSIHFENLTLSSASMVMEWGRYRTVIPVRVDEHDAILQQIERRMKGPSSFDHFQAALYLHETGTDLPLALTYIRKVTASEKALFFQVYREALILRDLGKDDEAIQVAKRSMKLSREAGNEELARLSKRMIDSLSK